MNIGVIGCGYWGPNLLRNLYATGRCEGIFCHDGSPRALDAMLNRFPYVSPCTSLEQLLGACDGVMIATPVKSHYAVAKRALEFGRAVFVEKPLTASLAESVELTALAAHNGLPLMTGHTFLYSPAVRKIREYLVNGTLGECCWLSSTRVNLGKHRQDVNVLWDLAPHDLSMFLYWLGEGPSQVQTLGRACVGGNVDFSAVSLQFPSGAVAVVQVSWLAPSKLRQTLVVGREKMIVYDDNETNEKIKLFDKGADVVPNPSSFGEYQLSYRTGDILAPFIASTEPLLAQTHAYLDWIENGVKPENSWIALQVVATIEAACQSLAEGGRPVMVRGTTRSEVSKRKTKRSEQRLPAVVLREGS